MRPKKAIAETQKEDMEESGIHGYRFREISSEYAGAKQRWLVVYSQKAYDREYETMAKNTLRENEKMMGTELWHLENRAFACEADALKAAKRFNRKLRYHTVPFGTSVKNHYEKKGRPDKTTAPALITKSGTLYPFEMILFQRSHHFMVTP